MSSDVLISIIIPIYNVADYLEATLDSVKGQDFSSFEVIMMDDGSSDGSGSIAEAFSAKDSRFRYIRKDNEGVSVTRNKGISLAQGKYLLLLDADDIIPEGVLASLYKAAEDNQADVVTGRLMHLKEDSTLTSVRMSELAFKNYRYVTTAKDSPSLIYDSITCGKLIKKSFWDELGLTFPAELSYCEDMPLAFRLYCSAQTVVMLDEIVYLWRVRGEGSQSATQSRNVKMVAERLTSLRMIDDIIRAEEIEGSLVHQKKLKSLIMDFNILINKLTDLDDDAMAEAMKMIGGYMTDADLPAMFREIPVIYAQKYKALLSGDCKRLRSLRTFQTNTESCIITRRVGETVIGLFPSSVLLRRVANMDSTIRFEPLRHHIDKVEAVDGAVTVSGCMYIRYLPVRTPQDVKISAWIKDEKCASVRQLHLEQNTTKVPFRFEKKDNSNRVAYAGTGYRIMLTKDDFESISSGKYRIFIEWSACGQDRERSLFPLKEEMLREIQKSGILEGSVSSTELTLRKEPVFTVG